MQISTSNQKVRIEFYDRVCEARPSTVLAQHWLLPFILAMNGTLVKRKSLILLVLGCGV